MIVRGAFNHLLRPGLREDFRNQYEEHSEEYSQFLKVGDQERAEEERVALSGLSRMVIRGEGEAVTYVDPKQSDRVVYVADEFGLGFIVSKQAMEDDLYSQMNAQAVRLSRSVRLTQEYLAAELLDDAFAGSNFTGLAGEALISATHSLLDAPGTWTNRLAGDAQLGVAGLQAAFEIGENTVDHNGDPVPVRINHLIVNTADEWAAIQLTQNDMEPYTANNNLNDTRRKRQLSYMVSHYKDQSGSDWFAQDKDMCDSYFLFRRRPEMSDTFDFDTDAAKFKATQRILVYFFDQRGWIGSNAS